MDASRAGEVSDVATSSLRMAGVSEIGAAASDASWSTDRAIARDAETLSAQLQAMRDRLYAPESMKVLRRFSSGEAARLIGVSDGYLRQLSIAGEGPQPETGPGGRRYYSLGDINGLRRHLAEQNPAKARTYLPRRDEARGEHLQVIAVTNFKGGSGKTTTSAHLAQHLALAGYRVLAIDLDVDLHFNLGLGRFWQ